MANLMLMRWERLYSKPSRHELALEPAVAALGVPYRFQHPVWGAGPAFLDFYWPDLRVALEVDGKWGHSTAEDKAKDKARTARLDKLGILVVRVTNGQVDTSPTKTARFARAQAEKLRHARPLASHPVPGPTGSSHAGRNLARKGGQGRKGPARRRPRKGRGATGRPRRPVPGHGRSTGEPGLGTVDLALSPGTRVPFDLDGRAWTGPGVLVQDPDHFSSDG